MIRITHVFQALVFAVVAQMPLHIARFLMVTTLIAACFGALVITSDTRLVAGPVLDWRVDPDAARTDPPAVFAALGTPDAAGSRIIHVAAAGFAANGAERQIARGPLWIAGQGEIATRRNTEMPALDADKVDYLDLNWVKRPLDAARTLDPVVLLALLVGVCLVHHLALAALIGAGIAGATFLFSWTVFVLYSHDPGYTGAEILSAIPLGPHALAGIIAAILGALAFRVSVARPSGLLARTLAALSVLFVMWLGIAGGWNLALGLTLLLTFIFPVLALAMPLAHLLGGLWGGGTPETIVPTVVVLGLLMTIRIVFAPLAQPRFIRANHGEPIPDGLSSSGRFRWQDLVREKRA